MDSNEVATRTGCEIKCEAVMCRHNDFEESRGDYHRFLIEYGFKPEVVRVIVENPVDQIPMPTHFTALRRAVSPIQGQGLFAAVALSAGELIAPGRIGGKRTPAGRYINHCVTPNAKFIRLSNGDIDTIALRQIDMDEEVVVDYRQAASVNGWGLVCDRREAVKTLEARLSNRISNLGYKLRKPDAEIKFEANLSIAVVGYLPVQFVDHITEKI